MVHLASHIWFVWASYLVTGRIIDNVGARLNDGRIKMIEC